MDSKKYTKKKEPPTDHARKKNLFKKNKSGSKGIEGQTEDG